MAAGFFGNSEADTEAAVFGLLDQAECFHRIPQEELVGCVHHRITGEEIRPDGLLVFHDDERLRCLRGKVFALEIKPDEVVRDHLKMISELTEQARSYIDSRYDLPHDVPDGDVDGCIIYPNLDLILHNFQPSTQPSARPGAGDEYKRGVKDMHRRMLARQRIYELFLEQESFRVCCCDEWLLRYSLTGPSCQVSKKNHRFRRKVGSDYR